MKLGIRLRIKVPADVEAIHDFIAKDSPESAVEFILAAFATFEFLAETSGAGSIKRFKGIKWSGLRSWRVEGFSNYLIFYYSFEDTLEILAVVHGARDLKTFLKDRV